MKRILVIVLTCFSLTLFCQGQSNGYTLYVNWTSGGANPVDGQTYFIGYPAIANLTTSSGSTRGITFHKSGTVGIADLTWWGSGVAGSNENISIYLRLNNTTDYLVATLGNTNAIKNFVNTSINVPFVNNDYIEVKIICPTWGTNPTVVFLSGYLLINPTP